jgi:hypothetical protein
MTVIYLLDGAGQRIGPFDNREGVERFINMMALCGEDWADNKIVRGERDDAVGQNPARMDSCANPLKGANKLKLVVRRP